MTDYRKEFEEKVKQRLCVGKFASSSWQNFVDGVRFTQKILETLLDERDAKLTAIREALPTNTQIKAHEKLIWEGRNPNWVIGALWAVDRIENILDK